MTKTEEEELFKAQKTAVAEQGKVMAFTFIDTLLQLAERQNELLRKVEFLKQEISH